MKLNIFFWLYILNAAINGLVYLFVPETGTKEAGLQITEPAAFIGFRFLGAACLAIAALVYLLKVNFNTVNQKAALLILASSSLLYIFVFIFYRQYWNSPQAWLGVALHITCCLGFGYYWLNSNKTTS